MQLHDPMVEDNSPAIYFAAQQLYNTRELPPGLLAQMDKGMSRNLWRNIHKAEKQFLENMSDDLHPADLAHPVTSEDDLSQPNPLQGYDGAAGAVAAAAAAAATAADASPPGSPAVSNFQVTDYPYSQGNAPAMYTASVLGQHVGGMTAGQSYPQHAGLNSHFSSHFNGGGDVSSNLPAAGAGSDAGFAGVLSSAVPGAIGVGGLQGSGSSAAAAAGASDGLLSPQPLLMGCDDTSLAALNKLHYAWEQSMFICGSAGASGLGSCTHAGTGTPMNGSPLLNQIAAHEQQLQAAAGLPASAAYGSSAGMAEAAAEFARHAAGHLGHNDAAR
jgi:hypothetical protein